MQQTQQSHEPLQFATRIYGTGEMADCIRTLDWSQTPLGPIEHWPEQLLNTVNILLAARQPMFLWWGPDLVQFYNDEYRRILGADKHPSALGQQAHLCWPEIWPIISPLIDDVMQRGKSVWREDQLLPIFRDGLLEDVYWTFSYSPVRDLDGNICGTLVVCSETTARVLVERRLKDMIDAASDGILTVDFDWTLSSLNENALKLLASNGDMLGQNFWSAFPSSASHNAIDINTFREAMESRIPGHFEAFYAEPINAWFEISVRPSLEGITLFFSDISARKQAENAVLAERARLLEVLQQAPVFFALLKGPEHVITMVNPLYLSLVNHRDVLGKPVRSALPEAIPQGYLEILDRVYQGEPHVGWGSRYQAFTEPGAPPDERFIDFVYQPLRESDGSVYGILFLGVDVTDRKKAQDVLLETEKLAAVGRLASSIAHEINNPLESVTNLLYLIRSFNPSKEITEYLDMADQELRRVGAIANQTLRFHKQATKPLEVTGQDLIEGVLALYQGRIVGSGVRLLRRHRCDRPIRCFEGEIRQVLSNLIGNALDAMHQSGGTLIVRCRQGAEHRTGRQGIFFTVADSGCGMPPSVADRAFQPFFTTKGFVGTGLGLWISREIVARHDGSLHLRTSQRKGQSGTVLSVFLPFEAVTR